MNEAVGTSRTLYELRFALQNSTIQRESIFIPYRNINELELPHSWNLGSVPDDLSIVSVVALRSANASRNATISYVKLYGIIGNRELVFRNIQQLINLGSFEFIKRTCANHELTIMDKVAVGAQVLANLGIICEFSTGRGPIAGPPTYELGAPPGYPGSTPYPSIHSSEQFFQQAPPQYHMAYQYPPVNPYVNYYENNVPHQEISNEFQGYPEIGQPDSVPGFNPEI